MTANKYLTEQKIKETPVYQEAITNGWHYEIKLRNTRRAVYWFDENDKPVCGARKKPDKTCVVCGYTARNMPVCPDCGGTEFNKIDRGLCRDVAGENGRCHWHSKASPIGIAHHNTTHGGNSVFIPVRMQASYLKSLDDPKLLSLREDIALANARLVDLMQRIDTGESGETWRLVRKQYQAMKRTAKSGDTEQFAHHMSQIGALIDKGYGDYQNWNEIIRTDTHKRKLVESERKYMLEQNQMMSTEQAMMLLSFVVNTIKSRAYEHVADRTEADALLAAISADISAYLTRQR